MSKVTILLSETTGRKRRNIIGPTVRADEWYGTKTSHTITVFSTNFVGRIFIEACLESNPTENDWFPVRINNTDLFVEYTPQNNGADTKSFTIKGNFPWIRVRIDRSYLEDEGLLSVTSQGFVQKVILT